MAPKIKGPRHGLKLFALRETGKTKAWQELALQVDPVDEFGRLQFFDNEAWRTADLSPLDYLTFRVEDFGVKADFKADQLPCRGEITYELLGRMGRKTYGYLTNCGKMAPPLSAPFPVAFDGKQHKLESSNYVYEFNRQNYMQFNAIKFRNKNGFDDVARDSQLMIKADVKNFFTMRFDSDDIVSKLEATRLGPIGDLANLSFFLKILFFKIRMSLTTSVGFYEDSGHIPMMINIPVNATKYLNAGSGILYSWEVSPAAAKGKTIISMPNVNAAEIKKGYAHIAKQGMEHCKKGRCLYRYSVDVDGRTLSMDFGIDREHVKRGFFPHYVEDVGKFDESMGWDVDIAKGKKRVGMYPHRRIPPGVTTRRPR